MRPFDHTWMFAQEQGPGQARLEFACFTPAAEVRRTGARALPGGAARILLSARRIAGRTVRGWGLGPAGFDARALQT